MKVLYLHQYFSTPQGKVGVRSYEFAKRLVEEGHTVTMLCSDADFQHTGLDSSFVNGCREGMVEGIRVVQFEGAYSNSMGFIARLKSFIRFSYQAYRFVRKSDYDLLFATSTPLTIAIPGILQKMLWHDKRPFVLEVRDSWPDILKALGKLTNPLLFLPARLLERMACRSANRLIGLAPGMCEDIQRWNIPAERVALIPNACDLSFFKEQADAELPPQLAELLATKWVAVFAGTHGYANDVGRALDAAHILQQRGFDHIHFLFVGGGAFQPSLKERAEREGLKNCTFLGSVSKQLIPSILQRSKLGLMLLRNISLFAYGTSPNKFFDYIAASLPVLCNYSGWMADLCAEYECGVDVEPDNAEAFTDALVRLSALPEDELQAMGDRGLQLAKDRFDRSKLAGEFVQWLEATYAETR